PRSPPPAPSPVPARGSGAVPVSGLPPAVGHFRGRDEEIAALTATLTAAGPAGATTTVYKVDGPPGSGKTALVTEVARRTRAGYADGCLFLDLHGYSEGAEPLPPADALGRMLRRLGVPAQALPDELDERAALFRDRTRELSLLLVLDNARSSRQVRHLLPAGPRCATLVTSRNRLAALDDAEHLTLSGLTPAAATALLHEVSGLPDTPATRGACAEIVRRCGHLPLAVRIAAARMRGETPLDPCRLAGQLADEQRRLAALDDGDRSVRAALELSRAALDPAESELFVLLGLYPHESLDAQTAAAVSRTSPATAGHLLERLYDAGLLLRADPDRYRFHDVTRTYCRAVGRAELSPDQVAVALRALLDHVLRSCANAELRLNPHRYRFPSAADPDGPPAREFAGHADALAWLNDELPALVLLCRTAGEQGFLAHCWQLAHMLRGVFFLGRYWDEWERTHRWALAAARRAGDAAAESATLSNAALAHSTRNRLDEATGLLDEAIRVARAAGDRHAEYTALGHLAWVHHLAGRHEQALAQELDVLDFHRAEGAPRKVGIALRDAAAVERVLGLHPAATAHLLEALDLFSQLGLLLDGAMALNCLGQVAADRDAPDDAAGYFRRALAAARACGSRYERARAHLGLGLLAAAERSAVRAGCQLALAEREFTALGALTEAAAARGARSALTPPHGDSRPSAPGPTA
ncbi:tetratricopeptide repeat protein, partial [Actinacidiphila sp. bgisy145]|uniref:tetratricopeptide repeat protein n=1 Tax=Actinacidiphila sp. bgisy145 TaxID=3413792 RepID=UPI003EBCFE98